jgi:hypothetical protein
MMSSLLLGTVIINIIIVVVDYSIFAVIKGYFFWWNKLQFCSVLSTRKCVCVCVYV